MEKNFQRDCSLCSVKTFQTAVLILSGCKFESPNLKLLQKILLMFIADHSCNYYFKQLPLRIYRLLARLGGRQRHRTRRSGQFVMLLSV
jgi:hypothetical protein